MTARSTRADRGSTPGAALARSRAHRTAVLLAALAWGTAAPGLGAQAGPVSDVLRSAASSVVGPPSGTLVIAGGGTLGEEIWSRFVELAGGTDAEIVVIPTASADDDFPENWDILIALRASGASRVSLLHTRDREIADTETFTAPLRSATGVWIPGGRQHRLAQAYLGTRVHRELLELLDRGGVIGGSSAGASIQASFLVRGDPESNRVVISEQYREGFGLLRNTAVDQHLLTRNREDDLWEVLDRFPSLLGIGLDEGTALVVSGDRADVIGVSQAIFYDATRPGHPMEVLWSGEVFDLRKREQIGAATTGSSTARLGG